MTTLSEIGRPVAFGIVGDDGLASKTKTLQFAICNCVAIFNSMVKRPHNMSSSGGSTASRLGNSDIFTHPSPLG